MKMLPTLKKPGSSWQQGIRVGLVLVFLLETARAELKPGWLTKDRSRSALSHPFANLDDQASDQFVLGRSFFHVPWVEAPAATTARDGLGPLFNANSCDSCHPHNGGGAAVTADGRVDRSIIIKLANLNVETGQHGSLVPDPVYGSQLSINGTHEVPFEGRVQVKLKPRQLAYADGSMLTLYEPLFTLTDLNYGPLAAQTRIQALRAPALVGLGMIEQIPLDQIERHADESDQDQDGISGRVNRVWSVQDQDYRIGRYGWKATSASVTEQAANALINDMGLTSPWFEQENCTDRQTACQQAYSSAEHDVPMQRLQAISFYLQHLRKPRSASSANHQGRALFGEIGCNSCHRNGYVTAEGITINPYSDFLLHDMGPGLAGQMGAYQAGPAEWKTPPLWGIGLAKTLNPNAGFLHDGRAATLE